MKQYDENKKVKKKKDKKNKSQHFFDEDRFYEQKINKEFKYRKKYLTEDDDEEDLRDWQSYK